MKNPHMRKLTLIYLVFALLTGLVAIGTTAAGIVFRQYVRIIWEVILFTGLIAILLIHTREIPHEQSKKRLLAAILTVIIILFILIAVMLQVLFGIDQESVIEIDGKTQILVERSWFIILERSYYDYINPFWYRKNPHYTESFDDGDPNQLVYIDYYNEDGVLTERIFTEDQED